MPVLASWISKELRSLFGFIPAAVPYSLLFMCSVKHALRDLLRKYLHTRRCFILGRSLNVYNRIVLQLYMGDLIP